ncbi:hypothetical protein ACW17M_19435 [Vreelandella sp. 2A-K22]
MPPLLPEILNQPIQVSVQAMSPIPTDWWTIAGTVAGTLIGALLGGLISHWATLNAQNKIARRDNAEKIFRLAKFCREELQDIDTRLVAKAIITEQIGSRPQLSLKKEKAYLKSQVGDLCATVNIHFYQYIGIIDNTPNDLRELFRRRESLGHLSRSEEIEDVIEIKTKIEAALDDVAEKFLAKIR